MQAARGTSLSDARTRLIPLVIVALGLGLDQFTKVWAEAELSRTESQELIGSFLQLRLVYNPGAAFSTGSGMTEVLTCIAIAAALVVAWLLMVKVRDRIWMIGLSVLLAGILGNLMDRLFRDPGPFRGHVVDFLELPNWPVFNLADCFITCSAILIVIHAGRGVNFDGTREGQKESTDVER